jgi:pyroglutamyl-peptidase
MRERRILVTGFEPWANHAANPAQQLAARLDGWRTAEVQAIGLVLPVARGAANATVAAALRELRPDAVVHLGLAAGRPALTVERWAHNLADFVVPDNAGAQPRNEPLREDGRKRLTSRLSVASAVGVLQAAGVAASPSDSAGSFVCNAVLYGTLDWAAAHGYAGPVGFVHLPTTETIPLEDQERAVERLLRLLAGEGQNATGARSPADAADSERGPAPSPPRARRPQRPYSARM